MTKTEMRTLLLELRDSRVKPQGFGPEGFIKRLRREAEILHTLADESGSLLIYILAKQADHKADIALGRTLEWRNGQPLDL